MEKQKLSGPAIFMYSVMALTATVAAVCFTLHYMSVFENGVILWTGIVSFMILYHFGLRIFMGKVTKRFNINYNHPWYKHRRFEEWIYKCIMIRKWKDKVLTFEPELYDVKNRTLDQLATTMSKSELDHWINEIISMVSILFALLWGQWAIFISTAVIAMLFDAQFIVVQRYNRPIVLKLIERQKARAAH